MPDLADLYPGYASRWIDTAAGKIFARTGGSGPPYQNPSRIHPCARITAPAAPPISPTTKPIAPPTRRSRVR